MESLRTYRFLLVVSAILVFLAGCAPDENEKIIATHHDTISYSLGVAFAKKIPQNLKDNNIEGVDLAYFVQGIYDYFDSARTVKINDSVVERVLHTVIGRQFKAEQEAYVKENEPNKKTGDNFLEKNKQDADVIELKPGLQYKIIDNGWGKLSPILTDTILISFKVYNTQYIKVYSSEQTKLCLGAAIPALQEVLPKIKTGGSVRIYTSHEYAYGSTVYKQDLVKPYETLVFDVTVNKIRLNAERLAEYNRLSGIETNN